MRNPAMPAYDPAAASLPRAVETSSLQSAVSWAAIIGGAVAAASVTLVLLALGGGIGLTTVSPWFYSGVSLRTFSIGAAIWLIVVQWLSSGVGGYLAGRLRTKWTGIHSDEVFFRDTAHGFLAWALATVVGAAFLASATAMTVTGAAHGAATIASGAAMGAGAASAGALRDDGTAQAGPTSQASPMGYLVDSLFRPAVPARATAAPAAGAGTGTAGTPPTPSAASQTAGADKAAAGAAAAGGSPSASGSANTVQPPRGEIAGILAMDLRNNGSMPPADRTYIAQSVAARTGLSQADAEKRVDDVVTQLKNLETQAREAADAARKAAATFSIFAALALAIGAFIASAAAAYGGQLRDTW